MCVNLTKEPLRSEGTAHEVTIASGEVHSIYCGAFARACRPGTVMTYNVFRSLCGCFITYCTSAKRASPALEATALTMRPRSPAARNAFKNQISSLVKSTVIHDRFVIEWR